MESEERITKIKAAQSGDKRARDEFLRENLGLVHVQAPSGRLRNDCFQAGVLGLMRALDLYDPAYGVKFSTYAHYWINFHIKEALAFGMRSITVPRKNGARKEEYSECGVEGHTWSEDSPEEHIGRVDELRKHIAALNPRERHVMERLLRGSTCQSIADERGVTRECERKYKHSAMAKIKVAREQENESCR